MTKTSTGLCAAILALAATGAQAEQHMAGEGMMGQSGMMGGGMMPGMTMAMMDADGDGMLSREEAQAVHDRMFGMADADGDGNVTMEEMRAMMGGGMMGGMMDDASQ